MPLMEVRKFAGEYISLSCLRLPTENPTAFKIEGF
jgi:hypothetical protein